MCESAISLSNVPIVNKIVVPFFATNMNWAYYLPL